MERVSSAHQVDRMRPAVAEAVGELRVLARDLASRAGAVPDVLERVAIAVSEAVSNVVEHAYDRGSPGWVRMTASVGAGEITVLVADSGRGLGGSHSSVGLGLGLGLLADACDSLSIMRRSPAGTLLEMRFALPGESTLERDGANRETQRRGSVLSARRAASPRFSTTR
jgi:anti-sigma regulatory factor (Ser/Thr protein kinase)